jgi:hypothetical protein
MSGDQLPLPGIDGLVPYLQQISTAQQNTAVHMKKLADISAQQHTAQEKRDSDKEAKQTILAIKTALDKKNLESFDKLPDKASFSTVFGFIASFETNAQYKLLSWKAKRTVLQFFVGVALFDCVEKLDESAFVVPAGAVWQKTVAEVWYKLRREAGILPLQAKIDRDSTRKSSRAASLR